MQKEDLDIINKLNAMAINNNKIFKYNESSKKWSPLTMIGETKMKRVYEYIIVIKDKDGELKAIFTGPKTVLVECELFEMDTKVKMKALADNLEEMKAAELNVEDIEVLVRPFV